MIYVLKIRKKKKFRKDLENLIRQKKDISKLDGVVEDLQNAKKLSPEKKDEKMKSMKNTQTQRRNQICCCPAPLGLLSSSSK